FEDPQMATQNLAALQAKPHVLAAALYTTNKLFASYLSKGASPKDIPPTPPPPGHRFLKNRLLLCQQIFHGEEKVGSIYVRFSMVELWQRIVRNCGTVAAMLAISGVVAFFITARLQRVISKP